MHLIVITYDNTARYCLRLEPAHRNVSRRLGLSILLAMIDSEGEKPLDLCLQFELVAQWDIPFLAGTKAMDKLTLCMRHGVASEWSIKRKLGN